MHQLKAFGVAALALCAMAVPTFAQAPSCEIIAEVKTRLDCRREAHLSYRAQLEGALVQNGSIAGVFVEETGNQGSGAYPKLVVWTALDEAKIYQLISEAKILDGARRAGFRTVQFTDKGSDGHWFFNLTKPGIAPIHVELERSALHRSE